MVCPILASLGVVPTSGNPKLPPGDVAQRPHRIIACVERLEFADLEAYVDHWFGREAWNGRAPDVMDSNEHLPECISKGA